MYKWNVTNYTKGKYQQVKKINNSTRAMVAKDSPKTFKTSLGLKFDG